MGPLDALWHLLNLFGVAFGLALTAPSLAKLVWRRELRGVAWAPLAGWSFAACAAVTLAGLALTGHDGRMATYGAMVLACAGVLWWRGFLRPGR